ncbi:hypothetical protein I2I11_09820 [Pontibacter sp. 172403-2]|uniref:hypothetical protein n=1 Tax=Pontibacter rufus TaxID=2791028 RepID=UPI0018B00DA4|nr:hypothetical protein [Pontibacter sp. 172403-2]MBF9253588.1 hypothetical protein [Pontibacter sp. 172403-2]
MRPAELDVTLTLYNLTCNTPEDSGGDEPYMWILGFKVDAETIGPPLPGSNSILPNFGVKVFQGVPAFPNLLGPDESVGADPTNPIPIPAALGTRSFRLKPALLPLAGWFPGIAGIVSLLWEKDNFDPGTAEAGHKKFNELFGPALSTEITNLINGGFDEALSKDANGNATQLPAEGPSLPWRLSRLRDAAGRKNAVKAITNKVKEEIINSIKDAITDEAGLDELFDPDDMLGVDAAVFLGDELTNTSTFSLSFTDDEADYTAKGFAIGARVHVASLISTVTKVERTVDKDLGLWLRVCWFDYKLYWAHAFKLVTTTKFELKNTVGELPTSVRWFLDDTPLTAGQGSISVVYEPVDIYAGPPQDALASYYTGGPGLLSYNATGSALEVTNQGGNGVFYGKVSVLYAYAGDPSLSPPPPPRPISELLALGYEQEAELGIMAVELEMNEAYNEDIKRCKRVVSEIDQKHIAVNMGKAVINPGDPPPYKQALLDRVTSAANLANAVGLRIGTQQNMKVPSLRQNQ